MYNPLHPGSRCLSAGAELLLLIGTFSWWTDTVALSDIDISYSYLRRGGSKQVCRSRPAQQHLLAYTDEDNLTGDDASELTISLLLNGLW